MARLALADLVARSADATPDAPAVLGFDREPLAYGGLLELVVETAGRLRTLGVRPRNRVALVLRNGPEAATAFLGIASAVPCAPLNPAYRKRELDFYLTDLEPKALVVDPELDSPAADVARRRGITVLELRRTGGEAGRFTLDGTAPAGKRREGILAGPSDVALLLHTSGTTSRPKLVPLTHANLCDSARNVAASLELTAADRCLNVMPLFHIHGLVAAVLASLHAGGSVACAPAFHAPSFFAALAEVNATWYTAVPTIHQAVLARANGTERSGRLRFVRSSSAPLPTALARDLEDVLGVPVVEAYGMTEAAHQMASNPLPPGERRHGSVGRPAGPEIAIVDGEGCPLPTGSIGEVAIRGPNVFAGYDRNPQANELAFVDGWFRTGDEGSFDEDGYLYLRGRIKEIINRAGEKVAPGEVEDALLAHDAVAQAVAFAIPDARLGEDVGAAVVLRDGAATGERELQVFVADRLADFKVPRTVAILDEIPKGATGKLQRIGLAERLGIGERTVAAPVRSVPRNEAERRLAALWREILDLDEVGVDDDFFDLGGDSILAAELVSRLREQGAPALSLNSLLWAPTIALLAAELERGEDGLPAALVPIQTAGSRPPLVFVHALDGHVVRFGALARSLGPEQPFYAFREPGVEEQKPRFASVRKMAAHYVDEVRALQPRGPYLLGALCMGAPIAIEMARALLDRGEQVALLALVDPNVAAAAADAPAARRVFKRARRTLVRLDPRARGQAYPDHLTSYERSMAVIRDAHELAPYPGRATVFLSGEHAPLDWLPAIRGGTDVHEIGGTHMGLMRHPGVDRLGELLRRAVEAAA